MIKTKRFFNDPKNNDISIGEIKKKYKEELQQQKNSEYGLYSSIYLILSSIYFMEGEAGLSDSIKIESLKKGEKGSKNKVKFLERLNEDILFINRLKKELDNFIKTDISPLFSKIVKSGVIEEEDKNKLGEIINKIEKQVEKRDIYEKYLSEMRRQSRMEKDKRKLKKVKGKDDEIELEISGEVLKKVNKYDELKKKLKYETNPKRKEEIKKEMEKNKVGYKKLIQKNQSLLPTRYFWPPREIKLTKPDLEYSENLPDVEGRTLQRAKKSLEKSRKDKLRQAYKRVYGKKVIKENFRSRIINLTKD
jgi:hypothetical protein